MQKPTRLLRHLPTIILVLLALWALPRLLPHLRAVVGVRDDGVDTPHYVMRSINGADLTSDSLRGRVVLINVWATWCIPCRVEMPLLESTWQRHRAEGLVLIGASVDRGDPAAVTSHVAEYVANRGVTYPVSIVNDNLLAAIGGVTGYPTSILIGRDGRVRHRVVGPIGPVSLEPAIRRALAEPPF